MKLGVLLDGIATIDEPVASINISHITTDAALVTPNSLYVAVNSESSDMSQPGVFVDGRKRINLAIKNGAKVIFTSPDVKWQETSMAIIHHTNPIAMLGKLAARINDHQAPGFIAAVTGTNGKSSTVMFASQLWTLLGNKGASIGNLGINLGMGEKLYEAIKPFSVPETVDLHEKMRELKAFGIKYVAMEATSHALHDYRLSGLNVDCGVFTNLTHDHLDFHSSVENYFQTKMSLFDEVINDKGFAIIYVDNPYSQRVIDHCHKRRLKVIDYGYKAKQLRLINVKPLADKQIVTYALFDKEFTITLPFIGEYQALNLLAAIAIVHCSGIDIRKAISVLSQLKPIPGRLELITHHPKTQSAIYCDYAHSEDAYKKLLTDLRTRHNGKLIVVFSCHGDRDSCKRPVIGKIVHELSDIAIVTDGFYQSEQPEAIRKQIINNLPLHNISGRQQAIAFGLGQLRHKEDCLVICGMGEQVGPNGITDSETVKRLLES